MEFLDWGFKKWPGIHCHVNTEVCEECDLEDAKA